MPTVSGVDIKEVTVNPDGPSLTLSAKFKSSLPVLIHITATAASGVALGEAIINDGDPTNNEIVLGKFPRLFGEIVWLRVMVHHPALNKFDFKIFLNQGDSNLITYDESGSLNVAGFFYEGFILRGVQ